MCYLADPSGRDNEGLVNGNNQRDWGGYRGRGGPRHGSRGSRPGRGNNRNGRAYGKKHQDPEYPDYPTEYTQVGKLIIIVFHSFNI